MENVLYGFSRKRNKNYLSGQIFYLHCRNKAFVVKLSFNKFSCVNSFFTSPYVTRKERDCKDDPKLIYCENS